MEKTASQEIEQLREERNRLAHQRNMLGRAIADAAISAGLCREDANLTGPHLLDMAQGLGEALIRTKNELELAAERLIERPVRVENPPAPDFAAVEGKRIGELSPTQMDDATELWLRNNSGWFHEREYLEFLLHRLDQARGITPSNEASKLCETLRPGSTETKAQEAGAPMINPELEDMLTSYHGLRNSIISTGIEMAIIPPDYNRRSATHTDVVGLIQEMATQTGTSTQVTDTQRRRWNHVDLTNPVMLGQTQLYNDLADPIYEMATQLGKSPLPFGYPLTPAEAKGLLQTIATPSARATAVDGPLDLASDIDDHASESPTPW